MRTTLALRGSGRRRRSRTQPTTAARVAPSASTSRRAQKARKSSTPRPYASTVLAGRDNRNSSNMCNRGSPWPEESIPTTPTTQPARPSLRTGGASRTSSAKVSCRALIPPDRARGTSHCWDHGVSGRQAYALAVTLTLTSAITDLQDLTATLLVRAQEDILAQSRWPERLRAGRVAIRNASRAGSPPDARRARPWGLTHAGIGPLGSHLADAPAAQGTCRPHRQGRVRSLPSAVRRRHP